jgi:hypothetical protein
LVLITLVAAALVSAANPPCELTDAHGKPFPVCFDPGNGFELEGGLLQRNATAVAATPRFSTALVLRTERASRDREGSNWFNLHRILETDLQTDPSQRLLGVTVYEGTYRRHVEEGFVLVPVNPPLRLPFPFDVAVQLRALTYERRIWEGRGYTLEVARAALLFDPIRSVDGHARLSFGPSLSYTIRNNGTSLEHELSPFSSVQADLVFESDDGWWNLRFSGVAGWVFVPAGPGRARGRGEVHLERVLVAVNDQPLYATLVASGAFADAGVPMRSEFTMEAGLMVRPWGR